MKDECRKRFFGIGPKKEEILVDHAESGIHRNRNRPLAKSLNRRRRKKTTSIPSHWKRLCIKDIGGKARRKEPLGRPRRRWVDNIKMDLREVGWYGRDWIDLAQDRDRSRAYVNAVMNLRVP
jgi:hypothetical protein